MRLTLQEVKDLKQLPEVREMLFEKERSLLKELSSIQERKKEVDRILLEVPDNQDPITQRKILHDFLGDLNQEEAHKLSLHFFKTVFPIDFEEAERKALEQNKRVLVPQFISPCRSQELETELKRIRFALKTPEELSRLRQDFDLEAVRTVPFEAVYSFEKQKIFGDRLTAICPFHSENSPSFVVYQSKLNAHCYGCGWNGDVIAFYMQLNEVPFLKACRELTSLL